MCVCVCVCVCWVFVVGFVGFGFVGILMGGVVANSNGSIMVVVL